MFLVVFTLGCYKYLAVNSCPHMPNSREIFTQHMQQARIWNIYNLKRTLCIISGHQCEVSSPSPSLPRAVGQVTLRDFKQMFDRPGFYRYHFKTMDKEFGMVKEEVRQEGGDRRKKECWLRKQIGGRNHVAGGMSQEEGGRRQFKESRRWQEWGRMRGGSNFLMFQITDDDKLLPGVEGKIVVWVEEEWHYCSVQYSEVRLTKTEVVRTWPVQCALEPSVISLYTSKQYPCISVYSNLCIPAPCKTPNTYHHTSRALLQLYSSCRISVYPGRIDGMKVYSKLPRYDIMKFTCGIKAISTVIL